MRFSLLNDYMIFVAYKEVLLRSYVLAVKELKVFASGVLNHNCVFVVLEINKNTDNFFIAMNKPL